MRSKGPWIIKRIERYDTDTPCRITYYVKQKNMAYAWLEDKDSASVFVDSTELMAKLWELRLGWKSDQGFFFRAMTAPKSIMKTMPKIEARTVYQERNRIVEYIQQWTDSVLDLRCLSKVLQDICDGKHWDSL